MSDTSNTVTADRPDAALAQQMGRDRMPLRLTAQGRTLVVWHDPWVVHGGRLVIQVVIGANELYAATASVHLRPTVDSKALLAGGTEFGLADGEAALISAWLDGYFGAA